MSKLGRGQHCAYCRRTLESTTSNSKLRATRDHVHPQSLGGTRKVWCCLFCNGLKANMTAEQWSNFMKANPRWWATHPPGIRLTDRWKYLRPPEEPPQA